MLAGQVDLVQEIDGDEHVVEMHAGDAVINPPGVWHRSFVHEPGWVLFITPGSAPSTGQGPDACDSAPGQEADRTDPGRTELIGRG